MRTSTIGVSIKVGILVLITGLFTSCDWVTKDQPSFLIIAVDSLGFEKINCETESETLHSGFYYFCQEAVTFTHAYTTSTLNQPAISSLLTGKYPLQIGVHNNGSDYLKAQFKTLAEVALEKNYRTSFFSGGAPIWRKSGLSQGFENFSDYFKVTKNKVFRPAKEVFSSFLKWHETESPHQAFFSFLYLPDLQHYRDPQLTDLEKEKSQIETSYLNEINTQLYNLRKKMMEKKIWDTTTVVLVGLKGETIDPKKYKLAATDLRGPNIHVSLYIKPQHKTKLEKSPRKIDNNVSLADVGTTLFDLLDSPITSTHTISFKSALKGKTSKENPDRLIYFESAWNQWRLQSDLQVGLRLGHYHILLNPFRAYNVLVDRDELHPIKTTDPLWGSLYKSTLQSLYGDYVSQYEMTTRPGFIGKIKLAQMLWYRKKMADLALKELKNFNANDKQTLSWQASIALEINDWNWLKKVGEMANEPLWIYVAQQNLGQTSEFQFNKCAHFFQVSKEDYVTPNFKMCGDTLFIKALDWVFAKNGNQRIKKYDSFVRAYRQILITEEIEKKNYVQELTWDVKFSQYGKPSLTLLFLNLPKNKSFLNSLR